MHAGGHIWEISVLSPQFFCEPKTALEKLSPLKKKKDLGLSIVIRPRAPQPQSVEEEEADICQPAHHKPRFFQAHFSWHTSLHQPLGPQSPSPPPFLVLDGPQHTYGSMRPERLSVLTCAHAGHQCWGLENAEGLGMNSKQLASHFRERRVQSLYIFRNLQKTTTDNKTFHVSVKIKVPIRTTHH